MQQTMQMYPVHVAACGGVWHASARHLCSLSLLEGKTPHALQERVGARFILTRSALRCMYVHDASTRQGSWMAKKNTVIPPVMHTKINFVTNPVDSGQTDRHLSESALASLRSAWSHPPSLSTLATVVWDRCLAAHGGRKAASRSSEG